MNGGGDTGEEWLVTLKSLPVIRHGTVSDILADGSRTVLCEYLLTVKIHLFRCLLQIPAPFSVIRRIMDLDAFTAAIPVK